MDALAAYHMLLREAFEASEAVDQFDLDSKNARSLLLFEKLKEADDEARRELVKYVVENADRLK